jgi:hypothetical protein
MIYFHTKFHNSGSKFSLVIAVKQKATLRFYESTSLLFLILQNIHLNKCSVCKQSIMYAILELYAIVACILQVRMASVLYLMAENYKGNI